MTQVDPGIVTLEGADLDTTVVVTLDNVDPGSTIEVETLVDPGGTVGVVPPTPLSDILCSILYMQYSITSYTILSCGRV